ncbi:gastrula zinc finger protein XlCGF26.1 isoform X17 [Manduca sexta]|uniref:gastrula zinc finger protein XlCGF26.1 isoform X17 n=1 Tax=Manduca sexta TaxID=7130 RepID=UPI00188EC094|nr:gastrula zinc finger protein XlCGF26.1 isoform X17 [Manduca sexta]
MDGKTSDWRPGPSVCRCCLAEGCYKDISTEYFWMGKREVYADMLSDTFSVSIAYSSAGGPNSHSRLICEPCISRLRDAADFKRQVQECERTFMQHLDPGSTSAANDIDIEAQPAGKEVKLEQVKLEKRFSDDDFDTADFGDEDDDDMDDQPLTKFATKVPKKEAVDFLDLIDNSQITVKRMSMSKSKAPPAKKVKVTKKEPAKPTASKAPIKVVKEKKKKEQSPMHIARQNARTIVVHTTAYPFRLPESDMVCVYCHESYSNPDMFREHMTDMHMEVKLRIAFAHVSEGFLKVDCTDLRCRICNEAFDELKKAAEHINSVHNKVINFEYELGLQPFKVKSDLLMCGVCGLKSSNVRTLSRHIQTHFVQCTCESCGKSYASATSLKHHIKNSCSKSVSEKQQHCRRCKIVFDSPDDQKKHLEKSKRCCQHICNVCGDRFGYWRLKQQHMEDAHGIPKKKYPCPECQLVFPKHNLLRHHFQMHHTNDHWVCSVCDRKFDREYTLNRHMIVHTGEKAFVCDVCSKAFPRKSTLTQHMWIHSEVKRHECKMCDKYFNQKVTWKTHMKSRHPELCDF